MSKGMSEVSKIEPNVWTAEKVASTIAEISEEHASSLRGFRNRLDDMSRRLHRIGLALEDEDFEEATSLWKDWNDNW